jgi:hypothetical protein
MLWVGFDPSAKSKTVRTLSCVIRWDGFLIALLVSISCTQVADSM